MFKTGDTYSGHWGLRVKYDVVYAYGGVEL
jgi:hypothetical protein